MNDGLWHDSLSSSIQSLVHVRDDIESYISCTVDAGRGKSLILENLKLKMETFKYLIVNSTVKYLECIM